MWVFGYGSLIWNPGFDFLDSKIGFIQGYARRFWQGNDYHRGNPKQLGRVATLVEDDECLTWGRAFLLGPSSEASLAYLDTRESKLGGYGTTVVSFQPRGEKEGPIPALLYVAQSDCSMYLGPAPLSDVADDICSASGHCGHNAEYLLRLASFMREEVPEALDEHLYHLEHLVRTRLKERGIPVQAVMAAGATVDMDADMEAEERRRRSPSPPPQSDFASRVPRRKLRCVNI